MEYIDWDLAEWSIVSVETFDKDSSWSSELICQYENFTDDRVKQSTL